MNDAVAGAGRRAGWKAVTTYTVFVTEIRRATLEIDVEVDAGHDPTAKAKAVERAIGVAKGGTIRWDDPRPQIQGEVVCWRRRGGMK